ncbi:MAG: ABC transporter ATP-binding protein [Clostridia bacterium]|nr:ABC transporter ATP-binding protein [Clostridia bacterium]
MIQVKNVKKDFNQDTKIHMKDIEFQNGKSYAILGVSGSGKTTLLNMIAGIVTPTEGQVFVDDVEITKLTQKEKDNFRLKNIGYIFQDFKLIEDMTVEDNLSILQIEKVNCIEIDNILKQVGLETKKKEKVRKLSGGEKQRVAIARALMKSPKIILADEPTGSLNYEKGVEIMELLKEFHKKSKHIMLFVTHDDRMAKFADEVIHFEDILVKGGEK